MLAESRLQLLEEVLSGTSQFGHIPNNIGEIVYCDTTKDPHKINTSGTDYFLGTKGFCTVEFEKNRSNIIEIKTVLFDEIEDVLISKIHGERNYVDWGIFYTYYFMSKYDNNLKVCASFSGNNNSTEMMFLDAVDSQWTEYLIKKNRDVSKIVFRYYDESAAYSNFIILEQSTITINGKSYKIGDVKLSIDNGSLLVRGANCRKVLNMYFGDHQWYPLKDIGNSNYLIRLLLGYGWLSNR